jgi:hypothetical protein
MSFQVGRTPRSRPRSRPRERRIWAAWVGVSLSGQENTGTAQRVQEERLCLALLGILERPLEVSAGLGELSQADGGEAHPAQSRDDAPPVVQRTEGLKAGTPKRLAPSCTRRPWQLRSAMTRAWPGMWSPRCGAAPRSRVRATPRTKSGQRRRLALSTAPSHRSYWAGLRPASICTV